MVETEHAKKLVGSRAKQLMLICYKGVKGNFETVLSWYKDLFQHTEYLCRLLKEEPDFSKESLRQVFEIISCGCFSKSDDVTKVCL
jgi:hypothetical protein